MKFEVLLELLYCEGHNRVIFQHKSNIINKNWYNNLNISLRVNIDKIVTLNMSKA